MLESNKLHTLIACYLLCSFYSTFAQNNASFNDTASNNSDVNNNTYYEAFQTSYAWDLTFTMTNISQIFIDSSSNVVLSQLGRNSTSVDLLSSTVDINSDTLRISSAKRRLRFVKRVGPGPIMGAEYSSVSLTASQASRSSAGSQSGGFQRMGSGLRSFISRNKPVPQEPSNSEVQGNPSAMPENPFIDRVSPLPPSSSSRTSQRQQAEEVGPWATKEGEVENAKTSTNPVQSFGQRARKSFSDTVGQVGTMYKNNKKVVLASLTLAALGGIIAAVAVPLSKKHPETVSDSRNATASDNVLSSDVNVATILQRNTTISDLGTLIAQWSSYLSEYVPESSGFCSYFTNNESVLDALATTIATNNWFQNYTSDMTANVNQTIFENIKAIERTYKKELNQTALAEALNENFENNLNYTLVVRRIAQDTLYFTKTYFCDLAQSNNN